VRDINDTTDLIIGSAIRLHRALGPGLLESAYRDLLCADLKKKGCAVEVQAAISLCFEDIVVANAFFADLIVDDQVVVELKAVEKISPVHSRQLLTYLKFTGKEIGLLLNFGGATLREGIHRVANNYTPSSVLSVSA
jgi:iron complex transport system substrate-binding protein